MKRFFLLLVAAVLVGIIISRSRRPEAPETAPAELTQRSSIGTGAREVSEKDVGRGDPKVEAAPTRSVPAPQKAVTARATKSQESKPVSRTPVTRDKTLPAVTAAKARESHAGADKTSEHPGTAVHVRPPRERTAAAAAPQPASRALAEVKLLLKQGRSLEARKRLTGIYLQGKGEPKEKARQLLDAINRELVFNPRCLVGAKIHVVKRGENLTSIAKKYKLKVGMIARINAIRNRNRIREGQQLKIVSGARSILIEKSRFTLTLFMDGLYVKQYPVGIGEDNKTPTGTFAIDSCLVRPDWYPPGGGIIKYGEQGHLLGERWLGFKNTPGVTGIGIHGTNEPETLGKASSNGCIRMHNEDIVELYDFVVPGTKVKIVE